MDIILGDELGRRHVTKRSTFVGTGSAGILTGPEPNRYYRYYRFYQCVTGKIQIALVCVVGYVSGCYPGPYPDNSYPEVLQLGVE
jgi:hypothetical protein